MIPTTRDASRLLLDGTIALAEVEANGIRIDRDRLEKNIVKVEKRAAVLKGRLEQTDEWKEWLKRFDKKANLTSRPQLGEILFEVMGYECKKKTKKKQTYATDDEALADINSPFVKTYLHWQEVEKTGATFLKGIKKELCGELLHPSFSLNTVKTYRSSSDTPNFTNLPSRNATFAKLVRECFIPREGRVLAEIDYGALEFAIAACFWRDKGMVEYASDPKKDIHGDSAAKLFKCKPEQVSKQMRYLAKNQFVFPVLYGSYWKKCSANIWLSIQGIKMKDDVTVLTDHLREQGIKSLGDSNYDPPSGTYEHHVKTVEDDFNNQFPGFGEGKIKWWSDYIRRGWFPLMTGFRVKGSYSKNFLMNCPIQGPGFHCLLLSLIHTIRQIRKRKMQSLVVGEIHDSMLIDVPPDEIRDVLMMVKTIMTVELSKRWDWVIVPMKVEPDITKINGNWFEKFPVDMNDIDSAIARVRS